MAKILICLLLLFSFSYPTIAQEKPACNCATTLKEIITDVEANYPAYKLKVKGQKLSPYLKIKEKVLAKSATNLNRVDCFELVAQYLDFFQDNHLMFSDLQSYPKPIPYPAINKDKDQDSLTGTWRRHSDSLTVKIVRTQKGQLHTYTAFIVHSKDTTLKKGSSYFNLYGNENEFTISKHKQYLTTHLLRGRRLKQLLIEPDGLWQKINAKQSSKALALSPYAYNNKFKHLAISKDIYYMGIPEFNIEAAKFDSIIVKQIIPTLIANKTKHLIIDLRNNEGGNSAFSFLARFTYDKPITLPGDYVYASPSMIKRYQESANKGSAYHQLLLPKLKANQGEFVQRDSLKLKLKEIYAYPETVSIITNENCASSTEYLLYLVKPSHKVKVYGRHTAGTLDYSELHEPEKLTCKGYIYLRPTSKSFWVDTHPIDKKGIPPDVDLSQYPDSEWVTLLIDRLSKKP